MTAREVQLMLPCALEWTNQSFWFVCSLHSPLGYAGISKKHPSKCKWCGYLRVDVSGTAICTYLVKILQHEMLQKSLMAPFSGLCNQQQDWSHLFNPMWWGVQGLAQDSGLHSWPTRAAAPPLPLLCTFYYSPACLPLRTAFSPTVALILKMWKLLHKCLKNIGNFILQTFH